MPHFVVFSAKLNTYIALQEADDSPLAIDEAVVEIDVPQLDFVKQATKSQSTEQELKQIFVGNLGETLAGYVSALDQEGKKARFGVLSESQVQPNTTDDTSESTQDQKVDISEVKALFVFVQSSRTHAIWGV